MLPCFSWVPAAARLPRPAEEKRSKVNPLFSLQTTLGEATAEAIRHNSSAWYHKVDSTRTCVGALSLSLSPLCFLLKRPTNYQLKIGQQQQQEPPPLPTTGGGQTFVVNSLPGRKTIFLKRNNLFRMKQNQLNCERMF